MLHKSSLGNISLLSFSIVLIHVTCQFFSLRDLTNCNFESDIFHLLCDRPFPSPLQSIVLKLNEKGIHPQDVEDFAAVNLIIFILIINYSF